MAYTEKQTITLNGSGAITDELLTVSPEGLLFNIFVNKNSQANNPTITIEESGGGNRTLLDAVVESGSSDTPYPVRELWQSNAGVTTGSYSYYLIETPLTLTVTGGDNAGTVTVFFQFLPI